MKINIQGESSTVIWDGRRSNDMSKKHVPSNLMKLNPVIMRTENNTQLYLSSLPAPATNLQPLAPHHHYHPTNPSVPSSPPGTHQPPPHHFHPAPVEWKGVEDVEGVEGWGVGKEGGCLLSHHVPRR